MRRGTTPSIFVDNLPIPLDQVDKLYLIFRPEKKDKIILKKELKDAQLNNNKLVFTLTQEETLLFPVGLVERSIVIKSKNGARLESYPDYFKIEDTALNEVI